MGEITQAEDTLYIRRSSNNNNNKSNEVEITLKTIGPFPPFRLRVPSSIKVHDLRKLIAESNHLPFENLKLILRGTVLPDNRDEDDVLLVLNDGDSIIVATKPKPPAKHLRDDFEDDDLKFQLPPSANHWKKRLYFFLRHKLKLPDIMLMALFSLTLKAWIVIILWFILAPVAHRLDLGPLYILGTGFSIIFLNLGRREAGDVSAYSIFNEDFRELPGTLNADRVDTDIRAGQF